MDGKMKINLSKTNNEKSIKELLEFSIINIDKPTGPTSFDVSYFVRQSLAKLGCRKTSHFGTLDPKVTGVLPIALNRACKLTGFFLGEDKEYVGIMRIHEEVELDKVQKIIDKHFIGKIRQTPPVKSRVKRVEREREIKNFKLLEKDGNGKDILFKAEVQGGTYIRKLIDDLGKSENLEGAHMLELRRVRAGIFKENDEEYSAVTLYELEKALSEHDKGNDKLLRKILIPGEIVSELFPVFQANETSLKTIFTGKPLFEKDIKDKSVSELLKLDEEVKFCLFNQNRLVGVYKKTKEKGTDIIARPEFVLQPISG